VNVLKADDVPKTKNRHGEHAKDSNECKGKDQDLSAFSLSGPAWAFR